MGVPHELTISPSRVFPHLVLAVPAQAQPFFGRLKQGPTLIAVVIVSPLHGLTRSPSGQF